MWTKEEALDAACSSFQACMIVGGIAGLMPMWLLFGDWTFWEGFRGSFALAGFSAAVGSIGCYLTDKDVRQG